jgi:hypothetical protein
MLSETKHNQQSDLQARTGAGNIYYKGSTSMPMSIRVYAMTIHLGRDQNQATHNSCGVQGGCSTCLQTLKNPVKYCMHPVLCALNKQCKWRAIRSPAITYIVTITATAPDLLKLRSSAQQQLHHFGMTICCSLHQGCVTCLRQPQAVHWE